MGEIGTARLNIFRKDILSKHNTYKDSVMLEVGVVGDDLNSINLLTAADLTQCSYDIIYDFDCPVKNLFLTFDIPTTLSQLPYGLKPIDSYSYVIDNPEELSKMKKGSLLLHLNFPTLSNMQLIRSLVLTSVLTAFFSLFCLNAFYCVRKYSKGPQSKRGKRIYKIITIFILIMIAYVVYAMMFDKPIYFERTPPGTIQNK